MLKGKKIFLQSVAELKKRYNFGIYLTAHI